MSSFATAASRTPDQEPLSGNPLNVLANPDAAPEVELPPRINGFRTEEAATGSSRAPDVERVERLLSNLEARSMALVPYNYGNLREAAAPKNNTALLAGVVVAIWLSTVILAVAYMRYIGHSPFSADRVAPATPLVITPDADPQEQKVAASVDHLARALASSSQRMNELQSAVEKSNRDLQKIATKVNSERSAPRPPAARIQSESKDLPSTVVVPTNLPKNWHKVLDIRPTDSAIAHRGADGAIDYWIVPRGIDGAPCKVLPIGNSAEGVVVHNLEDGKDYIVTANGEWRNGALTPPGN